MSDAYQLQKDIEYLHRLRADDHESYCKVASALRDAKRVLESIVDMYNGGPAARQSTKLARKMAEEAASYLKGHPPGWLGSESI